MLLTVLICVLECHVGHVCFLVLAGGTGDEASHHVLVVGPAGCGKSALLSKWVSGVLSNHKDVIAIPYFVGCAPSTRGLFIA